jgi:hypothetical protein
MSHIKRAFKANKGAVPVVEASFVFPVILFVLAFLLLVGNAYYQKAQVEAKVMRAAQDGAAFTAAPLLATVSTTGSVPAFGTDAAKARPYRYLFGNDGGKAAAKESLDTYLNTMGSGMFSGMELRSKDVNIVYNPSIVYPTVSVDVTFEVVVPIRLLGMDAPLALPMKTHAEVPVSDMPELMRNLDAAGYYMSKFEVFGPIVEFVEKIPDLRSNHD